MLVNKLSSANTAVVLCVAWIMGKMNNSFQKLTVLFHCSVCCGPLPWNVTGCCQPELMRRLWQARGCRTVFQRHFSPVFASTSLTRSGFWLKKWILKVCPVSFKHRADPVHLKLEHFFFLLSGLEPEIQKLISKHKQELKKLRTLHEAELLQADDRAAQRYVRQCEDLRQQLEKEKEEQCQRARELAKQRWACHSIYSVYLPKALYAQRDATETANISIKLSWNQFSRLHEFPAHSVL